jgi:hypothetical protein
MTIRERMLAVYRNEPSEQIPVGIYGRYLPRGSCERLARELGLTRPAAARRGLREHGPHRAERV